MAVTDIGLAVNDRRKNANGEWIEEVTFVDVTVWGRTAEVMSEYLSKGSPVLIEGRLKARQLGKRRPETVKTKSDLRANAIDRRKGQGGQGGSEGGAPRSAAARPSAQRAQGSQQYNQAPPPDDVYDPGRESPRAARATIFRFSTRKYT